MIAIVDSGATKADWCIGNSLENYQVIHTPGISPIHASADEISQVLQESLLPEMQSKTLTHIYFYGAGCTPDKSVVVREALSRFFPDAQMVIGSDLLGAAIALCGNRPGIACIMGTGSNSGEFDGTDIARRVPSLGYVLGDDASGACLGKRLVCDCLRGLLPKALCKEFLDTYQLTADVAIDHVYRQPLAARYLASFTPFLSQHRNVPEVHQFLIEEFTRFFTRNVMSYNTSLPISFTGSVAYYFQQEIKEAAANLNLTTGVFIKSPLEGLIKFYLK